MSPEKSAVEEGKEKEATPTQVPPSSKETVQSRPGRRSRRSGGGETLQVDTGINQLV